MSRSLRIGAVNYLNAKPLIYGLTSNDQVELILDLPSRLADALDAGQLDVALVPSVELFRHTGYTVVSDACIACRGPVLSVRLYFRVPPPNVRTLALDEGSRTSGVLAQILIQKRFCLSPRMEGLPIGAGVAATDADAILLIGDRAILEPDEPFVEIWDLGERWWRWTRLPFVFAVWTARPGVEIAEVEKALAIARDQGLANISTIAAAEADSVGVTQQQCVHYLSENLHFTLGNRERQGLLRFYNLARELDLVPSSATAAIL